MAQVSLLLYFPALTKESSGGNRRRSLSTDFKALYGRVFL